MPKLTREDLIKSVTRERNRCQKLADSPADASEDAPELENIRGNDNISRFYSERAAALSWVLELEGK